MPTDINCVSEIVGLFISVFSKLFFLVDPISLQKITMDPHILAHINIQISHNMVSKTKNISELICDSYEHMPVTHVTLHCMV